jgi:hypothetical protein
MRAWKERRRESSPMVRRDEGGAELVGYILTSD